MDGENSHMGSMSVWMQNGLIKDFDNECQQMGLNRSIVLRQLVKRWLIQRKVGGKKDPLEVAVQ